MASTLSFDEGLAVRLPLPLAQLYRRAHYASTPYVRHSSAYYLWEASLKLMGSVAISAYSHSDNHNPSIGERLAQLARPSIGHWWEFNRRLVANLAEAGDDGFGRIREVLLGRVRDDLSSAAGLDVVLKEVLEGKRESRATVRITELFDRLVQYRNREFGHGAANLHSAAHYERLGNALLAGTSDWLRRIDVLAGRQLVYVADLRITRSGLRRIEAFPLTEGNEAGVVAIELPESECSTILPQRIYLRSAGAERMESWTSLHPLILFDPDSSDFHFFNGTRGAARVEYLCYRSGETCADETTAKDFANLLGHLLDRPANEVELSAPVDETVEPSDEEDPHKPGRMLGDFELLSRLGMGGMAIVYRAWQPTLHRQVAVKRLLRPGSPEAEQRFRREVKALGRVVHPNLVQIYSSGADGENLYYAMELIEGADLSTISRKLAGRHSTIVTLSDWHKAVNTACEDTRQRETSLTSTPMKTQLEAPAATEGKETESSDAPVAARRSEASYVREVVELVRQAASAAHALHEAKIIHRDIKPANIVVDQSGRRAVLTDLGVAQILDAAEGQLTRTRQFVGTLRYASPEQVLSVDRLDRRSDVYSMGATLWELLTLQPLFNATDATPSADLMRWIPVREPDPIRKYNRSISPDLEAIVHRCLEKDPTKRYATAKELEEDLARWLAAEPVRARRRTALYIARKRIARHKKSLAAAALVILALVAGGVWTWDRYYRVHENYFEEWILRRQQPEGVHEIDADQLAKRYWSIRVTRRGRNGPALSYEAVDHLGQPSADSPLNWILGAGENVARYDFDRDSSGNVSRIHAKDHRGILIGSFVFLHPTRGQYLDPEGYVRTLPDSDASCVDFTFSNEGLETKHRYTDDKGIPRPNSDGNYGVWREHNSVGRVIREGYLDREGNPVAHRNGHWATVSEYDAHGRRASLQWVDAEGRPMDNDRGFSLLRYESDEEGNDTGTSYFHYDSATERFIPAVDTNGVHASRVTLDIVGRKRKWRYFGRDGEATVNTSGIAGIDYEYDSRGNTIRRSYVDKNGQPTLNRSGYAGWTSTFDESGNEVEVNYFGKQGKATLCNEGNAGYRRAYDDKGREVRREFVDKNGELTFIKDGYAGWERTFDERGNESQRIFFGPDKKPVTQFEQVAGWINEFNEQGRIVRRTFLGVDGKPRMHKDGYASWEHKFDPVGNRIESSYHGPDGELVDAASGCAKIVNRFNAERRNIADDYVTATGRRALVDGVGGKRYEFDDRGNIVKVSYVGQDGEPGVHPAGNASFTANYDTRGNRIREEYWDKDGRPYSLGAGAACRFQTTFDDWGRSVEVRYFDAQGDPAINEDGYHRSLQRYDEKGNQVEYQTFDVADRPTAGQSGYAGWTAEYNRFGSITKIVWHDAEGKPGNANLQCPARSAQYDEKQNRIALVSMDASGNVVDPPSFAQLVNEYDPRGYLTKTAYLDSKNQPIAVNGYAAEVRRYDPRGDHVLTEYHDEQGKLIPGQLGWARCVAAYDEFGRIRHRRFFNEQEEPIPVRVVVKLVVPGGQGDQLGLQPNDVLVRYEDADILDARSFIYSHAQQTSLDRFYELDVKRGEEILHFRLRESPLECLLDDQAADPQVEDPTAPDGSGPQ